MIKTINKMRNELLELRILGKIAQQEEYALGGMNPAEKKRCQEKLASLYKKLGIIPSYYDGVIAKLESEITTALETGEYRMELPTNCVRCKTHTMFVNEEEGVYYLTTQHCPPYSNSGGEYVFKKLVRVLFWRRKQKAIAQKEICLLHEIARLHNGAGASKAAREAHNEAVEIAVSASLPYDWRDHHTPSPGE